VARIAARLPARSSRCCARRRLEIQPCSQDRFAGQWLTKPASISAAKDWRRSPPLVGSTPRKKFGTRSSARSRRHPDELSLYRDPVLRAASGDPPVYRRRRLPTRRPQVGMAARRRSPHRRNSVNLARRPFQTSFAG
jgi:hypothetical protein